MCIRDSGRGAEVQNRSKPKVITEPRIAWASLCGQAHHHVCSHTRVQAGEEDVNFDGKPDVINFVANLHSDQPVYGIKALVQFTYSFNVSACLRENKAEETGHLLSQGECLMV